MVLVQYQYHIGREGASLSSTGLLIKYCIDMVATIKVLGQANVDAQPARMAIIWKVMVKVMVMMCEALKDRVLGLLWTALLPVPPDSVNAHNMVWWFRILLIHVQRIVISSCLL